MATAAELINRRIGRLEALAHDLFQVKPGYQPTELELRRAQELYAALARVFGGNIAPPAEAAPAKPEVTAGKSGKK